MRLVNEMAIKIKQFVKLCHFRFVATKLSIVQLGVIHPNPGSKNIQVSSYTYKLIEFKINVNLFI